jgi:hypothetical protein
MSLPSKAEFFNIYGDLIGECFVNIGWFVTDRALVQVIVQELPSAAIMNPRVHYVELYGFSFPIDMVLDMRSAGLEASEILLSEFKFVKNADDEYLSRR